jgi:hypothetical protein
LAFVISIGASGSVRSNRRGGDGSVKGPSWYSSDPPPGGERKSSWFATGSNVRA